MADSNSSEDSQTRGEGLKMILECVEDLQADLYADVLNEHRNDVYISCVVCMGCGAQCVHSVCSVVCVWRIVCTHAFW